ncbi:3-phenylpropionate/cinnamic acid dioxygenase subunit beta [Sphingopyxis sp.]|uniref:aromatic-ring-hydroxylating dioxygenase subunit beta n=1 Tax=Sphingopyxis sp. TaxID=1908224 RepID=UPI002D77DC5F|nr:3-phenylpropionate/cinnamic acid dioxygenase subunit beta [Sphingopyxis sp.]HET6523091.1 3-phenylpropionate/cinnamic acid dioxygenase subunit beta [Sphingopyxis sp.]
MTLDRLNELLMQLEIEQFLQHEASLIDDRRFHEWLDLFTEDAYYWAPTRTTRLPGDEAGEFAKPGEGAFFDDTKELLSHRVRKLESGFAWSEDPASRTRHFVTGIRILEDMGEELNVSSNLLLFRTRLELEQDLWSCRRVDRLRRTDQGLRICRRDIFLDHTVLQSPNISIFF